MAKGIKVAQQKKVWWHSWFVLLPKQKGEYRRRQEERIGLLVDILLAFAFGVIPMPVAVKWLLWFCCWTVFIYIVVASGEMNRLPRTTKMVVLLTLSPLFLLATNSVALSEWKREKAEALHGHLSPRQGWLSRNHFPDSDVRYQVGPGEETPKGTVFAWKGPDSGPEFDFVTSKTAFRRVNGELLLTTEVRNRNGAVVVVITDNDWTVSSSKDVSWEHNYTDDSLEVKDERGRIVLQLTMLPDRLQIQGEWWHEGGRGVRMMRPYPFDPIRTGPIFVIMTPVFRPDEPAIHPLFAYPSDKHFGERPDSNSCWFQNIFVLRAMGFSCS